ncbi:hypothetical protein TNCV_1003681 [Trichonephila clavipes]|nr:hypothetical protein TNCV_1003681 [Trichonephila clavipes]
MDDNAGNHQAGLFMYYLQDHSLERTERPAQSPDLKPLGSLFGATSCVSFHTLRLIPVAVNSKQNNSHVVTPHMGIIYRQTSGLGIASQDIGCTKELPYYSANFCTTPRDDSRFNFLASLSCQPMGFGGSLPEKMIQQERGNEEEKKLIENRTSNEALFESIDGSHQKLID